MKELLYFDCNARFGPRPSKHKRERRSKEHLLEDLELTAIAGALVVYEQSLLYDPMFANRVLIDEIEDNRDVLYPCWVAMPPCCGEFPEPGELVKMMADHDVRAVRIAPDGFNIPVREHLWTELRDALAQQGTLVQVTPSGFGGDTNGWRDLWSFLDIFRDLPVLLMDYSWADWKSVIYLMDAHPNLHVEFSCSQGNRQIEYFAGRYGAERGLFGTNLPYKSAGAARTFLDWTFLPDDQAERIASKNLIWLLRGAGPAAIPGEGRWTDSLTQAVRARQPLPCLTIDAHSHLLHDGGNTAGDRGLIQICGDAQGVDEVARHMGIDKTASMSWTATINMNVDLGNEIVGSAVRRFPDRFVGVCSVNPEIQSAEEIRQTIQTYHEELSFAGLEPFVKRQLIGFDDEGYAPWFEYANEHGLYILIDWLGEGNAESVVQTYPNVSILAAHAGRSYSHADGVMEFMREYPNIYAEVDYTAAPNGLLEYYAEQVGADRVLFGTDAAMRDQRPQAGWFVFSRLSEEEKRLMLGGNFNRVLRKAWDGKRELHVEPQA